METLNNKILDAMFKSFLENAKIDKEIRKINKLKYIPVVNTIWMTKNNFCAFLVFNSITYIVYTLSIMLMIKIKHPSVDIYRDIISCLFIWGLSFHTSIDFNKFHIKELKNKAMTIGEETPLSKQDFETIMNNFNHDLVEKIIKENNGKLCYKDLKRLDDLLLKQDEVIIKIEQEKIEAIWKEIDSEVIFEKFKGKNEEEIINELNSMGFPVKDRERLRTLQNFYSSLREKKKEECVR